MKNDVVPELDQAVIDELQKLVRYNIDSRDGYCYCAERVSDEHLTALFNELCLERGQNISELQAFLITNAEKPVESGTYLASAHRTWIDIHELVSFDDTLALLKEIERGENYLAHTYQTILATTLHESLNEVLHRHYGRLRQTLETIESLQSASTRS